VPINNGLEEDGDSSEHWNLSDNLRSVFHKIEKQKRADAMEIHRRE
jgi:hypothetical protein